MERRAEISRCHRTSIILIIIMVFLRMVLHLTTYVTFVPKFSYTGDDLTVMSGMLFYLFLFTLLIVGILNQHKLVKIYAIFLTLISFLGLLSGNLDYQSLNDYLWTMHFILLVMATVLLFLIPRPISDKLSIEKQE